MCLRRWGIYELVGLLWKYYCPHFRGKIVFCNCDDPITTIKIREGFAFENKNFVQKNERSLSGVLTKKDYNKTSAIISFIEEHREITPKEAENVEKYLRSLL